MRKHDEDEDILCKDCREVVSLARLEDTWFDGRCDYCAELERSSRKRLAKDRANVRYYLEESED